MSPRILILAALLFVAAAVLGVYALRATPRRHAEVPAELQPEPEWEQPPDPGTPRPNRRPTLPAPATDGALEPTEEALPDAPPEEVREARADELTYLPEDPDDEQRSFLEEASALIPLLNARVQQCVSDARVAPEEPPQVAMKIAAVAAPTGALCRAEVLESTLQDVYVKACLEDVMDEFECPSAREGALGAAIQWVLNLRGPEGLR